MFSMQYLRILFDFQFTQKRNKDPTKQRNMMECRNDKPLDVTQEKISNHESDNKK